MSTQTSGAGATETGASGSTTTDGGDGGQQQQANQTQQGGGDTGTQTEPTETVDYWKTRSRQNEAKAKANADAAKKLAEIEDANKSEIQKANDKAAEAERKAAEAELKATRLEVAQDAGLTATQAKRLVGANREELEADAKQLVKDLGVQTGKPDLKQGQRGKQSESNDMDAFIRRSAGR